MLADIGRQAQSRVASARGPRRLLMERAAGADIAQAGADIAARTASEAQRADIQQQEMERNREERLLAQVEAGIISEEQMRRELAKPGFLPSLLTGVGAAAGGYFGGAQGAQTGGGLGQAIGRGITTSA